MESSGRILVWPTNLTVAVCAARINQWLEESLSLMGIQANRFGNIKKKACMLLMPNVLEHKIADYSR